MRPTRLLVQGFTAFRDLTEVDFDGAELFALTGPTGAGKSSVIDAMVFALYGSVSRLDRRAVAPIVSLGRNEARVVLDFTVGGVAYTAARVVRRTKNGATTKEARLESGGEVLAGNEKELTEAVEQLLGLRFEHFTTCVVLPQGDFMRLLHASGGERQDLLVSLLDLGLFERMAHLASARERAARHAGEVATTLLEKLAFATDEAEVAAAARVTALDELRHEVDAALPELDRLADEVAAATAEVRAAAAALQLLDGVAVPAGLADHAAALIDARDQATVADADAEQTADAADAADAVLAQMPPRVALEAALRDHVARQRQRAEQARLAASLVETEAAVLSAASVAAEADAGLRAATEAVEAARWEHRAHDLAGSLVAGEPCPVCRQVVSEVPIDATPADLDAAGEAQRAADTAASGARRALEAATRERDRTQATVEAAAGRLAEIDTALAAWPDAELVSATLAEVTAAEDVARHARDAAAKARRTAVATRRACQEAEGQEAEARRAFDAARDRLASLDPPPAARHDIASDWATLAEWAESRRPDHAASGAAATARATAAEQDREALVGRLTAAAAGVGVRPARAGDLRGPVADALAQAAAERERIDRARVEAIEHRDSASAAQRDADVAKELARLLNANHFEKWMLDEALAVLVEGATELLLDLSDGAYSLGLDERSNFLVVDHRNADEVRPARTLSGGETFLASLALALALADQIGSLAAGGAAHLESIFLDEGFGSLDPATLDTVATAIEELGSRDRMVGLISHVAELAERVPVRFEVAPGPAGSTITKVVA